MEPSRRWPFDRVTLFRLLTMMSTPATPTAKQRAARAVAALPEDATLEDVMERIAFLRKIEIGLEQSRQGLAVSQAEVRPQMGGSASEKLILELY